MVETILFVVSGSRRRNRGRVRFESGFLENMGKMAPRDCATYDLAQWFAWNARCCVYPRRATIAATHTLRVRSHTPRLFARSPLLTEMAAIANVATTAAVAAAPARVSAGASRRAAFHGLRVPRGDRAARLPSSNARAVVAAAAADDASDAASFGRRDLAKGALAALAAPAIAAMPAGPARAEEVSKFWTLVDLPLEPGVILLDIAFVDDKHGFLLGTRQTILETFDGGKTWDFKAIPAAADEDVNYRFNSVSFKGKEGWIVGKPAILLHTVDGGDTWERVGLSPRLPGAPVLITATSENGQAELVTDEGAIYLTTDAARNWKAAVEETISATLNRTVSSGITGASYYTGTFSTIARNDDGEYIGLSSRGNFYMTWAPGQAYWQPHNRSSARRVQSMGWRPDGGIWELTRGGGIFFSTTNSLPENDDDFEEGRIGSRGFGLLDLGAKPDGKEFWIVGGSGSVFYSKDAGKSWKRDRGTDDVAANLYNVKFHANDNGFILGNDGILLRYTGA